MMRKFLAGAAISLGLILVPGIAGAQGDPIRLLPGATLIHDFDAPFVKHKVHKVYKKPKIMKKRVHEPFFFLGPFVDPWPPHVHHRKTGPHCGPWPGYYPCWQLNERNGSSGGPQGN
jgi:hypothetical protein